MPLHTCPRSCPPLCSSMSLHIPPRLSTSPHTLPCFSMSLHLPLCASTSLAGCYTLRRRGSTKSRVLLGWVLLLSFPFCKDKEKCQEGPVLPKCRQPPLPLTAGCAPCLPYFLSSAAFAPWQDHSLQILAQEPGPVLRLGVLIMACACPQ